MASRAWKNGISGNWNAAGNWSGGAVPSSADDASIALIGNYTVSVTSADVANSLTFDAPGATLSETTTGSLTMAGELTVNHGTARLNAANSFGGGAVLNGGLIAIGNGGALGAGQFSINGGELLGTASETFANQLTMAGAFTFAAADGTTLSLNSSSGWTLAANSTIAFGTASQDGVIIWHTPAGSSVDASAHVRVNGGTLKAGDSSFQLLTNGAAGTFIAGGATVDLAGFTTRINNLGGTGAVTNSGAASALILDAPGGGASFGGQIAGPLSLTVAIGSTALTGANTYTGTTTVNGTGTLILGDGGTTGSIGSGAITLFGGLIVNHSNAVTLANAISGSGNLMVRGSGTATINTANSYSGGTVVEAATLSIGNGGALGSGGLTMWINSALLATATETIANQLTVGDTPPFAVFNIAALHGATLDLNGSGAWHVGSGSVPNTLTFGRPGYDGIIRWHTPAGSNIASQTTIEVAAGTLQAGDASFSTLLNGAINTITIVDAGAKIDLAGFGTTIQNLIGAGAVINSGAVTELGLHGNPGLSNFAGGISGALSLHVHGTVSLTGASTYTGTTTVESDGVLTLGDGGVTGSLGSGAITLIGRLEVDHSNAVTLANAISSTGQLYQLGTGTTTINTANSYSGGTTISAGTLAVGNGAALGTGNIKIDGGKLLATANETIANTLNLLNDCTIAAAHARTLNTSANWSFNALGGTLNFGAAGQDGTVVWHSTGALVGFPGNGIVDVRAGTLKAGDSAFGFLFTNVANTLVDAGAKIDVSGIAATINGLNGAGTVTNSSATSAVLTLVASTFDGIITGALSLDIKAASGVTGTVLTGTESFRGGTTVESGQTLFNSGTFVLSSDVGVTGADSTAAFTNGYLHDALFEKTGGAGTSFVTTSFTNDGTVKVTSGAIEFDNGFDNVGIVQGVLSESGGVWFVQANVPGQTTYYGGTGDNHFTIATAPTYLEGGGGTDTVELTASMTFAAGSLADVETVQVDDGVTANLSNLADGLNIVIASIAGGGASVLGTRGADVITGGAGGDTLNGGFGADRMAGGAGSDIYVVDNPLDKVIEAVGHGVDTLKASVSFALAAGQAIEKLQTTNTAGTTAINLTGNSFANTLIGNAGANVLNGGAGNDTLAGGAGVDSFKFSTALSPSTNVDHVTDFLVADDTIDLAKTIFTALTDSLSHVLLDSQFFVGPAAHDATDRIIYNSANGNVLYDADGNGAGAAVLFAELPAGLALTHDDFLLV